MLRSFLEDLVELVILLSTGMQELLQNASVLQAY